MIVQVVNQVDDKGKRDTIWKIPSVGKEREEVSCLRWEMGGKNTSILLKKKAPAAFKRVIWQTMHTYVLLYLFRPLHLILINQWNCNPRISITYLCSDFQTINEQLWFEPQKWVGQKLHQQEGSTVLKIVPKCCKVICGLGNITSKKVSKLIINI